MVATQATDQSPATPQEIWATLDRTAKMQEESKAEAVRWRKEAEKQWAESKERWAKIEELWAKNEERWNKTDERIKNANEKIGGLDNSLGEIVEHLVTPGIEERFAELGIRFDRINSNVRIKENGQRLAEVDLLLESAEDILAVEIKSKVSSRDVEKHEARLKKLRGYYDRLGDRRRILGAMAGAIFGPLERDAALEAGFYVMVQSGDTMSMSVPQGFAPREW
ncbi:MAG: hypothetical protein FWB78_00995 [Treponema sp.]|nr:hypothetical protein [Treponema sp.]